MFLVHVYLDFEACPSLVDTVRLSDTSQYISDFSVLNVGSSSKKYFSPRYTKVANYVCRDNDIFKTTIISFKNTYNDYDNTA
jgi:ABC-type Fe3+/spermidine/putrescine transport system ATPase subunit